MIPPYASEEEQGVGASLSATGLSQVEPQEGLAPSGFDPSRDLPRPGKAPCGTCPYRRDVPAGIWHPSEYAKLPGYDRDTWMQPTALFFCHQQDGHLCAGWVGCHDTGHLLSMRLNRVAPETFEYESPVPLFASGTEAAAHGLAAVSAPGRLARHAIQKLTSKRRDSAAPSGDRP